MSNTRRPARSTAGASVDYHRLAARMEEAQAAQTQRFEEMTDRILDSLHDLKADVRRVEERAGSLDLSQHTLSNRVADIERQVLETRETITLQQRLVTTGRVESAKLAVKTAAKSPLGLALIGATGFTTLLGAGEKFPAFVRAAEAALVGLYHWMRGNG